MVDEAVNLDLTAAFAAIDDLVARITESVKQAGDQASADLSASLSEVPTEIAVTVGDPDALTNEIAQAISGDQPVSVTVGDPDSLTGEVSDAIGSADTAVEVTLGNPDELTGEVSDAISSATSDAGAGGGQNQPKPVPEEVTGSFLSLTNAITASKVAAAGAAGETGALTTGLAGMGAAGAAATGGVAAFVGILGKMIEEGAHAQQNQELFNRTFGDAGDQFKQFNFGGLNESLKDLAVSLGSDDDAILGTVSRMAILGRQAGATDTAILSTNQQFVALAARAIALNPSLGSIEDVMQRLPIALSRGGRFAAQLGIDITQADIAAEALAEGITKPVTEMSIYEKAALGAQIATKKLGDSLGSDIQAGAGTALAQLKSFRQQIREQLEESGTALIGPAVDTLKQLIPFLTQLGGLIGRVGVALFEALGPIAGPLLRPLIDAFKAANAIITPLIPIIHGLAVAIAEILKIVELVLVPVEKLIDLLNKIPAAAHAVGSAIGTAADAVSDFIGGLNDSSASVDDMSRALGDAGVTVEAGKIGLDKYTKQVQTAKGEADKLGLTLQQFRQVADDLNVSYTNGAAIEAEVARRRGEAADATAFYTAATSDAVTSTENLNTAVGGTGSLFDAVSKSYYEAAHQLTDFEIAQSKALASAQGAPVGTALFTDLATGVEHVNQEITKTRGLADTAFAAILKAGPQAGDIVTEIAQSFNKGGLSLDEFQALAGKTGLSLNELAAIESNVRNATQTFKDDVSKAIGSITDATKDLDDKGKAHVADFVSELQKHALDAAAFANSISTLFARGANELAKAFLAAGPDAASAAREAAKASDSQLATFEGNVAQTKTLLGESTQTIDQYSANAVTGFGEIGTAIDTASPNKTDLSTDIDAALLAAQATVTSNVPETYQKAYALGTAITDGLAAGVRAGQAGVNNAATQTIDGALLAAQAAAETGSPSRLFSREVGFPITEGIAEGIRSGFFVADDAIGDVIKGLQQQASDQISTVFDTLRAGQSLRQAQTGLADAQQHRADLLKHQSQLGVDIKFLGAAIRQEEAASEAVTAREQQAIDRAGQNLKDLQKQFADQAALPASIDQQQRILQLTSSDLADLDAQLAQAKANLALGTGSKDDVQALQQARDAKQREVDDAQKNLDDLSAKMGDTKVSANDLEVAQEDLNDAIAQSHDPTSKLTGLYQQLEDAQKDQKQTADDLAKSTDDISDAQLRLLEAYEGAAEAGQKLFDQGGAGQDILLAIGNAAGFGAQQIQALTDQFANFAVLASQSLGGAGAPNNQALTAQPIDVFGTGVSFANSVQDAIAQVNFVRGQSGQGQATAADLAQFPWMHNTFNIYNQDPNAVAFAVTNKLGLAALR